MPADPTDDWTPVGVVFENHPIEIDGVNPWQQSWQSTGAIAYVRHPAHPTQVHDVSVYDMQVEGRTIRFAAGELSNGVWGFYRPWR
ncbi:hypothetical protein [Microcella sp.]|uniref:hypothetical protein n=1 Tax=Microcella sp. TaxID=1913979 RepID=UPI00391BBDC9